MNLEALKVKFLQVNKVSLDMLDEHPERMRDIFASDRETASHKTVASGRGYPFFNQEAIDANEKDRQNLEILAKW